MRRHKCGCTHTHTYTHTHTHTCKLYIKHLDELDEQVFPTYHQKLFHPSVVMQLPAFCLPLGVDFPTLLLYVPQNVVQLCPYSGLLFFSSVSDPICTKNYDSYYHSYTLHKVMLLNMEVRCHSLNIKPILTYLLHGAESLLRS